VSLSQQEFQQYKQSYEEFKAEANPEGDVPTYYPCRENETFLRDKMLQMAAENGLTKQQLWQVRLWSSLFMQYRKQLQPIPPPEPELSEAEKRARRNHELEMKDRRDGLLPNQIRAVRAETEMTEAERIREALKEIQDNQKKQRDDFQQRAEAARAKEAADADISMIPTVASLVETLSQGQEAFTPRQMREMSSTQPHILTKRLGEAEKIVRRNQANR
jgi:hypothetical protein